MPVGIGGRSPQKLQTKYACKLRKYAFMDIKQATFYTISVYYCHSTDQQKIIGRRRGGRQYAPISPSGYAPTDNQPRLTPLTRITVTITPTLTLSKQVTTCKYTSIIQVYMHVCLQLLGTSYLCLFPPPIANSWLYGPADALQFERFRLKILGYASRQIFPPV